MFIVQATGVIGGQTGNISLGIMRLYHCATNFKRILSLPVPRAADDESMEQHVIDTNAENSSLKLPQISNQLWCFKKRTTFKYGLEL
jgi:hypothetical protein